MHKRFIYVPETVEDMKKDYFGYDSIKMVEWELSDDEFNNLFHNKVFEYFNNLNNKNIIRINYFGIDEFEDDFICYQYLYFEYERIVEDLLKFKCKSEILKLIEMIDKAIKCRTILGFNL